MAGGQLILPPYHYTPVTPRPARRVAAPQGWGLPIVPNFQDWELGDIVLMSAQGVSGTMIHLGQQILAGRATPSWSHAALYAGNGEVVESVAGQGVRRAPIEPYCISRSLAVLRLAPFNGLVPNAGPLALGMAAQRIGDPYAWKDLVSLVKVWRSPTPQPNSSAGVAAYCSALIVQCYASQPINTALDLAPGCLPCLPATLATHPWLDDVPVEWCDW